MLKGTPDKGKGKHTNAARSDRVASRVFEARDIGAVCVGDKSMLRASPIFFIMTSHTRLFLHYDRHHRPTFAVDVLCAGSV